MIGITFQAIPDPQEFFDTSVDQDAFGKIVAGDPRGMFFHALRQEWLDRGMPYGDAFEQGWEAMLIQACFSLGMRKTAGLGSEWIAEYLGMSDEFQGGVIEIYTEEE